MRVPRQRFALAAWAMACACVGCVRDYRPPKPNEPHAILKLRRTYERTAGERLTETLLLREDRAYHDTIPSEIAATARTDAVLVHPVPTELTFSSTFTHQTTRRVLEHYSEQVPYHTTETYSCGTGTSYRTCSRPVTRYRYEPKTRWVNKIETVNDGSCSKVLPFVPKQGSTYLLQYTYQDHDVCSLSCFEQVASGAGSVTQSPCAP